MADLISAFASLLWPLLVIVVLLVFGRQLLSKLRSSDDVTLEIGGQRLNFKQAADQQTTMISDLQHEVAALKARIEDGEGSRGAGDVAGSGAGAGGTGATTGWGSGEEPAAQPEQVPQPEQGRRPALPDAMSPLPSTSPARSTPTSAQPPAPSAARAVLWVDDHPENNAMLAQSWRRAGAQVDVARSTDEALRMFGGQRYGLIISDMGRRESGVEVPDAGMQLLAKVRDMDADVPFVIYGNMGQLSETAQAAGATMTTRSTFELMEYADELGILAGA